MIIAKVLLVLFLLAGGNLIIAGVLDTMGLLTFSLVVVLMVEFVVIASAYLYLRVLKPLNDLHDALSAIDFNASVIDFTKVDSLKPSGTKELVAISKKFKYLLDIITERIDKINSETYKSEHDGLTGCYNRVRLENMKGLYQSADNVCIIFIDVNNLKKMNDIFGHEAGDALLRAAADKLTFWNNYGDVYRLGGDEFMIVTINKEKNAIADLIKRWYPTVGILNRTSDGFKCVLSYGVAYGYKGCDFDALQKQADDAMYNMKVEIKKKFGEPMR